MSYGALGTIWADMGLNYKGLTQGMSEAKREVRKFDREMQSSFERTSQVIGQSLGEVGRALSLGITAPMSVALGMASKWSMDLEDAMAKVWSITDITKTELQSFGDEVEALSLRVPQSASQLADGLYDAISSGIRDVSEAIGVVEVAAKAAVAGVSETATAVDALTTVINAYGMEADQAGNVTDLMFRTVDRGKITFGELAGSLGQVISTAATARVPFDEVAAAYATMTRGGINAAEASTALSQTILQIIKPTDQALEYAQQLGIEFNATALASKGLTGVLEDVYEATGGNIEATTKLFTNVRALKGVLALTRNDMRDFTGDLEHMAKAAGATEAAYEKQMTTMRAQMQLFKNELAAMGRAFGAEVMPVLNSGMQALKPIIQAFADLPAGVKQSAVQFGLFAAALGPVTLALKGLVSVVSGPAGWVLAAGAAAFAAAGFARSLRDVEGRTRDYLRSVQETISELKSQATEYGNQAKELDKLIARYEGLKSEADRSKEAQEELMEVVRRIGTIAPVAITDWDDLGRAMDINAEKARGAAIKMLEARKMLLEIALKRAEIEKPAMESIVERDRAKVEEAERKVQESAKQLDLMRDKYVEALRIQAEMEKAVAAGDKARQQQLFEEALSYGIHWSARLTDKPVEAMAGAVAEMKDWIDKADASLQSATESAMKMSTSYYDALDTLTRLNINAEELRLITERIAKGDLWAGLEDKEVKITPVITEPETEISVEEPTTFEQWSQKIQELSDNYKALKDEWNVILEELQSDDIAVQQWAEDRAGAIIGAIGKGLRDSGGVWAKAAAAASVEVKSGYQSLKSATEQGETELAKALSDLRSDVIIDQLGAKEQMERLEEIEVRFLSTGTLEEQRRFAEQMVQIREQLRSGTVASLMSHYRWQAQYWDFTAADHVKYLERLRKNEEVNADDKREIDRELLLWEKKAAEEEAEYKRQVADAWNTYYVDSGRKTRADVLREEVERRKEELAEAQGTGEKVALAEAALANARLALNKQLREDARDLYDFEVSMDAKKLEERRTWLEEALQAEGLAIAEERRLLLELNAVKEDIARQEAQRNADVWLSMRIDSKETINQARDDIGRLFRKAKSLAEHVGPEYKAAMEVYTDALDELNARARELMSDEERAMQEARQKRETELRNMYAADPAKHLDAYRQFLNEMIVELEANGEKWSDEWKDYGDRLRQTIIDENRRAAQVMLDDIATAYGADAYGMEEGMYPSAWFILSDGQFRALGEAREQFKGLGDDGAEAVKLIEAAMQELSRTEQSVLGDAVAQGRLTLQEQLKWVDVWLAREAAGVADYMRLKTRQFELERQLRKEDAATLIADLGPLEDATWQELLDARRKIVDEMFKLGPEAVDAEARKVYAEALERIARDMPQAMRREAIRVAEGALEMLGPVDAWVDLDSVRERLREYERLLIEHLDGANEEALRIIRDAITEADRLEQSRYRNSVTRGERDLDEQIERIDTLLAAERRAVGGQTALYDELLTERHLLIRRKLKEVAEDTVAEYGDMATKSAMELRIVYDALGELHAEALAGDAEAALAADVYAAAMNNVVAQIKHVSQAEHETAMRRAREEYRTGDMAPEQYKWILQQQLAGFEEWSAEWIDTNNEIADVTVEIYRRMAGAMIDALGPLHQLATLEAYDERYETLFDAKKDYEALEDAGVGAVKAIDDAIAELTRTEQSLFADMVRRTELSTEEQIKHIDKWIARETEGTVEHSRLLTQRFDLEKQRRREIAETHIASMRDLSRASLAQLTQWQERLAVLRTAELIPEGADALKVYDDMLSRIAEHMSATAEREHANTVRAIIESYGPVDWLEDLGEFRARLREQEAYYIKHHRDTSAAALKIIRDALAEADSAEETRYSNAVARSEVALGEQIKDVEALMREEERAGSKRSNRYEELRTKLHLLTRRKLREEADDTIAAYGDITAKTVMELRGVYDELSIFHAEALKGDADAALAADAYAQAMNRVQEQILRTSDAERNAALARTREEYRVGDMSAQQFKWILQQHQAGFDKWSAEWVALNREIEQVTSDIYRGMATRVVEALGPLDELIGTARAGALDMLADELAVYQQLEHGAAAASILEAAIKSLTRSQEEWAQVMGRVYTQLRTGFADQIDAIYDDATEKLALTDDPSEVASILLAATIQAQDVYLKEAAGRIKQIQKLYVGSAVEQVRQLGYLQQEFAGLELAGVLAIAAIQEAMDALNLTIDDTTKQLQMQVGAWKVDPLTVDLDTLREQKETYKGLVDDAALIDEWFAQRSVEAIETAIQSRIGSVERMNEREVEEARQTLAVIRGIALERVGVESEAMQAIASMEAQLALRRVELEEDAARQRQKLALDIADEMARLRGDDDEIFLLSLQRRIQKLREAGWSEVRILRWVTAHGEKVARERLAAEYQFRRRIGRVSLTEQLRHEQELAKTAQASSQKRVEGATAYYDALMAMLRDSDVAQLKSMQTMLLAHEETWAAMGEDAELYLEAVKAVMAEAGRQVEEQDFGKQLLDKVIARLGEAGSLIRTGMEAAANPAVSGDPLLILLAVFTDLALKARSFQRLIEVLDPLVQALADAFGELLAPLVPIVSILVDLLMPVIRAVANVFAWVADVVVGIWNAIAKTINFLLGWLGVRIPTIEKEWRDDYGLTPDKDKAGTQISEITGPTRDLLIELMRPLTALDSIPVYAASIERAIYSMRDAFLVYTGTTLAAEAGAASVMNEYNISTINIYAPSDADFDDIMESVGRRAELALLGSGA